MTPIAHCDHCPVAAGKTCKGGRNPRLCHLVAVGAPGMAAFLIGVAEGSGSSPPGSLDQERLRLAETCPSRVIPECGCSGMSCAAGGKRPGRRVSILDCYECLGASS